MERAFTRARSRNSGGWILLLIIGAVAWWYIADGQHGAAGASDPPALDRPGAGNGQRSAAAPVKAASVPADADVGGAVVVIDPGHGARSRNIPGWNGNYEEDLNLMVAKLVGQQLEARGVKAVLTRTDNSVDPPLELRAAMARRYGAQLFVSIHFNAPANNDPNARGFEILHAAGDETDQAFANLLAQSYQEVTGLPPDMRGPLVPDNKGNPNAYDHLTVLYGGVPSALIECGFFTNREDVEFALNQTDRLAQGISTGIVRQLVQLRPKTAAPTLAAQDAGGPPSRGEIVAYIDQLAREQGWSASFARYLKALFYTESGLQQNRPDGSVVVRVNPASGAYPSTEDVGIAQINDYWHPEVDKPRAMSDWRYNVREGAKIAAYTWTGREDEEGLLRAALGYKGQGKNAAARMVLDTLHNPPQENGQALF